MKKIVLFGDSLAAGYYEGASSDLLDKITIKELTGMGFPGYQIVNLGVPGETSAQGLARVEQAVAENPDFIAIMLGSNDALNQSATPEEYGETMKQIIGKFPAEKVIVLSPAYVDEKLCADGNNQRQQAYVAALKEVAGEMGVNMIDLYHHMTVYPVPTEFLGSDGLHPSEEGYDFIGALIARDIKNKLLG